MNGFLKYRSFEDRDASWLNLVRDIPQVREHAKKSTALPHIVLVNIDASTIGEIRKRVDGDWVDDVEFDSLLS